MVGGVGSLIRTVKRMQLEAAERELQQRLYRWAQATMRREVAEDFPAIRACQHGRHVRCFLEWIGGMNAERRLPICLTLVRRQNELHLPKAERSPEAAAVFMECYAACCHYHDILPPVPDSDRRAPGFVKADPDRCMEKIIQQLTPLCGEPRKPQRYKRKFIKQYGDWTFTTYAQIWLSDDSVGCHSFLQRSDSKGSRFYEAWPSRIDSLMLLGISSNHFIFVGQSHETLCADALRASVEMFVSAIPKLIDGLG